MQSTVVSDMSSFITLYEVVEEWSTYEVNGDLEYLLNHNDSTIANVKFLFSLANIIPTTSGEPAKSMYI